ncbi:MAG: type II toxin-antitoxin system HicB family antitoxin [Bacteroidetes bacterium]|nr:MAG: type II toxin-antitoxin system HicB family antitoxin [Bacteroidota bacterium]
MKNIKHNSIHLPVMIEQDEDGVFIVSCPVLKACHSYGKTVDDALSNLKEVIEMILEDEKPVNLNSFVGFREMEFVTA